MQSSDLTLLFAAFVVASLLTKFWLDSRQARTLADRALTLDSASAVRALVAEMH